MSFTCYKKDVQKLDHIGIATKNLTESLEFYEKNLGLKCSHIEEIPERGIRIAFLPLGENREINLELIEPLNNQSEISKFLEKKGPGLHHIAIKIKNSSKELEDIGFIEPFKKGAEGKKVAFIHPKKTGGVLLELCLDE